MKTRLRPVSPTSDRVRLTVRITSDGHREWLSDRGTVALVFFERGSWWSRPDAATEPTEHTLETEALDALLNEDLAEVREAARKLNASISTLTVYNWK